MIMKKEYKADLIEHVRETSQQVFALQDMTRSDVLHNHEIMDRLWYLYQKAIEDYDADPEDAYLSALESVVGIPADEARKLS